MSLSIMPVNNVNFRGKYRALKYTDIKNIQNMPCACCGKKVLIPRKLSMVIAKISKPLSSMIKGGYFDNWKSVPEIWNILENLAKENPKASFEKLTIQEKVTELYSAFRELVEKNPEKFGQGERAEKAVKGLFNDTKYRARKTLRSSSVVISNLAPLKSYLDDARLEVFEQFEIYSRKYPRKTLSEIVQIDEIAKFHQAKDFLQRAETRENVDFRFQNIINMVKKANPDAEEHFISLQDKALDFFESCDDVLIRREKIKELYQKALREYHCEKLTKRVNKELDQMPVSYITKDSFFAYACRHNYTDNQIVSSIFAPVTSTFEHVVPRSQDGKNKMGNGLVMHYKCNLGRGNMPYTEFIKYHKEMPRNVQKQVNYIATRVMNGMLDGSFRFWPMQIARTLSLYTQGAINLDLTRHCEKGLKETEKRIEERDELIIKLKHDRENKIDKKQKLKHQIDSIETELSGIGETVSHLLEENNQERNLIISYKAHIKKKKNSK